MRLEDESLSIPPPFSGRSSGEKRCCVVYTLTHGSINPMFAVFEMHKMIEARQYFDQEVKKAILENEFDETFSCENNFTGVNRHGFGLIIGIRTLNMNTIPKLM